MSSNPVGHALRFAPAALLVLLQLTPAWAGDDTDCAAEPDKCGREAFDAGVTAYQAGEYPEALKHFRRAYELKPHPAVALNLALAEAKNNLLLEAIERFDSILQNPEASEKLKADAKRERDVTDGSLSVLVLEITGNGQSIAATVDDRPMQGSPPTARLNPGVHRVRVVDGEQVLLERTVDLARGEQLRIAVQRSREVVVVPEDKKDPVVEDESGLDPLWFYVGAGATVALGAASVWSGLDTKSAHDDYEAKLPTLPQSEIDRRVDEGNGKETRTNLLLGATAVAAAGTAVMGIWLVDWNKDSPKSGRVGVVPGGVLLTGSF